MPVHYPSASDLHVNALTEMGIAYGQDLAKDYLADAGSTQVRVKKQSDIYPVWSKADFFRSEMVLRADGTKSERAGFRVDTSNTYFADVYALSTTLTARQKANADSQLMIEKAKVKYLMQQAKINRDKLYAAAVFASGLWTSNTEQTGVASGASTNEFIQFNDSTATPIKIIQTQMEAVYLNCGRYPNALITNTKVATALRGHSDFVNRVQYVGDRPAYVTNEDIQKILGIEKVLVARSLENTAAEGQTATMARIFGNHVLLAYIDFDGNPTVDDQSPTAITTFAWSAIPGVTKQGASIETWYDRDIKADIYEIEDGFDVKITANDAAVFLASAVA